MTNEHTALLAKYSETFIVYANLWEVERKLSAAELKLAREIRANRTAETQARIDSK